MASRGMMLVVVALACAHGGRAAATEAVDDPEARALVVKLREAAPDTTILAKARLSSSGGWVRDLEMRYKRLGDERATLVWVTAPSDVAGTRFLFLERTRGEDRQFAYLPKLTKRVVEVMAAARQEPFLGSDFYASDLTAPDVDAFTYRFVGDETIGPRATRLVEAVPKDPATQPYARSVLAIDPEDLLLVRVQTYDRQGDLLKVWTLEKVTKVDGIWTPEIQKMANVQNQSESVLEIRKMEYGVALRDELFTRDALAR